MLSESTPNSERDELAKIILDYTPHDLTNPTPHDVRKWEIAQRKADAVLAAGYRRQEGETEWGVLVLEGDEFEYSTAPDEQVARRRVRALRNGYPFPDEIQVVKRQIGPWVPVTDPESSDSERQS